MNDANPEDINKDKVPLYKENKPMHILRKYIYGIGGLPMQLSTNSISFFINIYLLEVAQMVPYHLFYVSFLGRFWDAVTDPIAGYLITITHTRWGNFKPFMIVSLPFLCISYFFLFFNFHIDSQALNLIYYVIMILIFSTAVTFYFIPYGSMCMVLTSEAYERDTLTAYRMLFEILGMLLGSAMFGTFISLYRPNVDACKSQNVTVGMIKQQEKGYMIATGTSIIIILLSGLISIFGSVEKDMFVDNMNLDWQLYKKMFCFQPYVILMITFACTAIGMMFVQANMALYIIHVLKMPNAMSMGILTMMVCSIIFIPIIQLIIGRFGKKFTYYSGMFAVMPLLIAHIFLPKNPGNLLFYACMVYGSYPVTVSFLLPWSMLPDCIDYFALINSIRKEAAFFSFFVFFQKFALGFAVGMTGIVLGLSKYDNVKCEQPEGVEIALRYLIGIGSSSFFMFAMTSLYFYPIDEKKRIEIHLGLTSKKVDVNALTEIEKVENVEDEEQN